MISWSNKLDSNLSKKKWTEDDGKKLFFLHKSLGPKWKVIIKDFPGRTDNFLKNKFFSLIRRSLRRIVKFLYTPRGSRANCRDDRCGFFPAQNALLYFFDEQLQSRNHPVRWPADSDRRPHKYVRI